jgi:hypothetical protein
LGWLGSPQLKLQRKRVSGRMKRQRRPVWLKESSKKRGQESRKPKGANGEDEECEDFGNVEGPPCPNANDHLWASALFQLSGPSSLTSVKFRPCVCESELEWTLS